MSRKADVIALLEAWLADARAGKVHGVFILSHDKAGEWSDAYHVDEYADLILELRTARFRVLRDANRSKPDH